jgi:predicted RNA-binding protein with PUA-like domain
VSLAEVKNREELSEFDLVRLPRLSVMPVSNAYWDVLREMLG